MEIVKRIVFSFFRLSYLGLPVLSGHFIRVLFAEIREIKVTRLNQKSLPSLFVVAGQCGTAPTMV